MTEMTKIDSRNSLSNETNNFVRNRADTGCDFMNGEPFALRRTEQGYLLSHLQIGKGGNVDHGLIHTDFAYNRNPVSSDKNESMIRKLTRQSIGITCREGCDPTIPFGSEGKTVADGVHAGKLARREHTRSRAPGLRLRK